MRGWLPLLGMLLSLPVAALPQLDQFGYGIRITTEGREAVQALPLHDDIYRHAVRPDLGDIRVFNAQGEMVPHLLRRPVQPLPGVTERVTLPLFPLRAVSNGGDRRARIAVTSGPDGAVVEINQTDGEVASTVGDYIVDLSQIRRRVDKLHFNWGHRLQGFVQHLTLEGSDDLDQWWTVIDEATLVDLRYGGEHLVRNTLKLPLKHGRYLRVSWRGERQAPPLRAVSAEFLGHYSELPRRWRPVSLRETLQQGRRHFEFELQGHAPVDRLRLTLPERNSLIQARLESRGSVKGRWANRFSGPLYRLQIDGAELVEQTITLSPNRDRYWRLVLTRDDGGLGGETPTLEVGWLPHHLLFIARGEGPFTLGFGHGAIDAAEPSMTTLIQRLETTEAGQWATAAWHGTPFELKGDEALEVVVPLPWKTWLLWAILLGAVIGLALLAVRLMRQIREAE